VPQVSEKAWFSVDEALSYLGLDPWAPENEDLLEDWCVEHDVDVEVDDDGNLLEIDPIGLKEALFAKHEREVGHRPDDPEEHEKATKARLQKDQDDKETRRVRKQKLNSRVGQRRAQRAKAEKAEQNGG
jgi:hypothetical protein